MFTQLYLYFIANTQMTVMTKQYVFNSGQYVFNSGQFVKHTSSKLSQSVNYFHFPDQIEGKLWNHLLNLQF